MADASRLSPYESRALQQIEQHKDHAARNAMGIMNLGSATTTAGRLAAFAELSSLTQALARNATWATLNRHLLTRVTARFAQMFSVRLTKLKLGQLVPIVGIAVGAGLNAWLLAQVSDAAYWSYRERFINEKLGVTTMYVPRDATTIDTDDPNAEDNISIVSIVESAMNPDANPRLDETVSNSAILDSENPPIWLEEGKEARSDGAD